MKRINLLFSLLILSLILGCENNRQSAELNEHKATSPPATAAQNDLRRAKCVGVIDGDTVDILTQDKKQVRLRLASIDAPERGQPFGTTAKKFLRAVVKELEHSKSVNT